jgi:hypothetical protein
MPLHSDPQGGGTNADGSTSPSYCSYCYQDGAFVNPGMSLEDMQRLVVDKLGEKGFPRFVSRYFARGIGDLERWRP